MQHNPTRRGFLAALIGAAVAPAIIRTPGLLMPIKPALAIEPAVVDVVPAKTILVDAVAEFQERTRLLIQGIDHTGRYVMETIDVSPGATPVGTVQFAMVNSVTIVDPRPDGVGLVSACHADEQSRATWSDTLRKGMAAIGLKPDRYSVGFQSPRMWAGQATLPVRG